MPPVRENLLTASFRDGTLCRVERIGRFAVARIIVALSVLRNRSFSLCSFPGRRLAAIGTEAHGFV